LGGKFKLEVLVVNILFCDMAMYAKKSFVEKINGFVGVFRNFSIKKKKK